MAEAAPRLADTINVAKTANMSVRRIVAEAGISIQHLYNVIEDRTKGGRPGRLRRSCGSASLTPNLCPGVPPLSDLRVRFDVIGA